MNSAQQWSLIKCQDPSVRENQGPTSLINLSTPHLFAIMHPFTCSPNFLPMQSKSQEKQRNLHAVCVYIHICIDIQAPSLLTPKTTAKYIF